MPAHSAGAYTATLLEMVNVMKEGGRAPPPSLAWANFFTLMMKCTPESSVCYSVYSVGISMVNTRERPETRGRALTGILSGLSVREEKGAGDMICTVWTCRGCSAVSYCQFHFLENIFNTLQSVTTKRS